VVVEVHVKMMLIQKIVLLLLLLLLLQLEGYGGGKAACIFTITTNHYNTKHAILEAFHFTINFQLLHFTLHM
jgi:hypothetical protein